MAVVDVKRRMNEGREPCDNTAHDSHGMSVKGETLVEVQNLLVHVHLVLNPIFKLLKLLNSRFLTIEEDKHHLDKAAFLN